MSHALCSCDLRTQSKALSIIKKKLNFYLCPLKNIKFDPINNL